MGKYVIGIDLGTTKSVVAVYEDGKPKIIENVSGGRITPSFVALKKSKDKKTKEITSEWIVGQSAKNQAVVNPLNTLYGVKRLIGRRFDDPKVAEMQKKASYKIVAGPNGDAWVEVDGKAMAPAEVSAMVLRDLKKSVEQYLGLDKDGKQIEVSDAVITCPAYFNDSQIKATKDAGAIAGLNVLRVIKEPTAAALAYGMDKKRDGKVIVYDLGGGTFDVSVLDMSIDEDTGALVKVLATNGDTFLGGENFDEAIIEHLYGVLKEETGIDLMLSNADPKVKQKFRDAAEKLKIELSTQTDVTIEIPFVGRDEAGDEVNFEHKMRRVELEKLVQHLIDRTRKPCEDALRDAGLTINDIDEVLLVGAQTRMPKVAEFVKNLFGKEPRMDISVQEIVAMGASVQAAAISGDVEGVILQDVTPLSIGIRLAGDLMDIVVPRNTTIPCTIKPEEPYSVAKDGQRDIEVMVFQGERPKASDNKLLGKFTMRLPPGSKKKTPENPGTQIELSFNIDANGALEVSAKNLQTGQAQKIQVQANGGLSEAEVAAMLKAAEENAEADRLFKARQEAVFHAESALKDADLDVSEDYFLQAPDDLKTAFNAAVVNLKAAVESKNADAMIEKTVALQDVRTKMGEAFTAAAQAAQQAPEATEEPEAATPEQPQGPQGPSV